MRNLKSLAISTILFGSIVAQTYTVGDVIPDFTDDICANGTGNWTLHDYYGAQNGGDHKVIWINCFATW
ncbi:MAG: hypothetical protein QF430_01425 [Candidatus Marinimicrobia bacterium]|jgi:hypothetical protein|nr:hypothetical protein [Candidatus Neomarinimicrobiota bacterium]MDP7071522.1 hypothetical protein [Candidatus Neomarinimicrobiota bacterium]